MPHDPEAGCGLLLLATLALLGVGVLALVRR